MVNKGDSNSYWNDEPFSEQVVAVPLLNSKYTYQSLINHHEQSLTIVQAVHDWPLTIIDS